MRICFQSIFNKTIFFKAVADRLEQSGHDIFWTATSQKWTDWLMLRGVKRENILLLRYDQCDYSGDISEENERLLTELESISGLNFKKIFFMDRVVSKWPWEKAKQYFGFVASRLSGFLTDKKIDMMLGEGTSSDEIINAITCQRHSVRFYNLGTIRIPSDRFAFFKGYLMAEFEEITDACETDRFLAMADDAHERLLAGMKPNYWHWNNEFPKMNLSFMSKLSGKVREALVESRHDATVKPLSYHLIHERQYLKPLRHALMRFIPIFETPSEGERYVLYTLHKQPEASIDVFGADYANQYELIKNISRNLPHDVWLYVKEHSNCLGDRSIRELKRIKRIPAVRLVNPFVDIHSLIKGALAVLSVSGTVAFEAGLHGIPAGTFSKMYFNALPSVTYLQSVEEVRELICSGTRQDRMSDMDRQELAHIIANSCEGVIGGPLSTPVCMDPNNIISVASGIDKLIGRFEHASRESALA